MEVFPANLDYLAGHRHQIEKTMADAAPQAFLPIKERDLFNLGSMSTIMGELNPAYKDPIFPDFCLEQLELEQWDSKVRSLYSAA